MKSPTQPRYCYRNAVTRTARTLRTYLNAVAHARSDFPDAWVVLADEEGCVTRVWVNEAAAVGEDYKATCASILRL